MLDTETKQTTALEARWRAYYDRLRTDIVEAQCALESGRLSRASEIIDSILRVAKRAGSHISPDRQARRRRTRS